jgi:hypothetical protein
MRVARTGAGSPLPDNSETCPLIAAEVGKPARVAHVVTDVSSGYARVAAEFAIRCLQNISENDQILWVQKGQWT